MASLTLDRIKKTFGPVPVIHGMDLEIRDGEFVVFVGPSGCGKSTLLRLIAGLETPTEGTIRIGGKDVTAASPAAREIAMVFQSYALYPHMTVRQNLSFGLENLRMPRAEIERRILAAAKMLAIEPYLDRRPKELSGGQRQRVAIGRSIVRNPSLFLFDEPLSNLDAALRVQTRAEISKLHRELGTTMIYVTHDQVEAMTMAGRIAVLRDGRLEQFGPPLELFNRPANKFVAGFIGSPRINMFAGRLAGRTETGAVIDAPGIGTVALPVDAGGLAPGAAVSVGIRPSHLRLGDDGPVRLLVQHSENVGTETYVYGAVEGAAESVVLHVPDQLSVAIGSVLPLSLPPGRCHVFREDDGRALTPLAEAA
ncbi:MAG: ABC transporter ATP-binding protein [Inquilinus sp.]|uniref:ABC transporter ATP-binding protein n=1 Tax=Inquilinus sp. TaxID=1932117 RepID=UPI003F3A8C4B